MVAQQRVIPESKAPAPARAQGLLNTSIVRRGHDSNTARTVAAPEGREAVSLRIATISTPCLIAHVDVVNLASRNPRVVVRTWLATDGREVRETRAATVTADLLPRLRAALDLAQEAIDDLAARRPA
jgi:hypothetical protein